MFFLIGIPRVRNFFPAPQRTFIPILALLTALQRPCAAQAPDSTEAVASDSTLAAPGDSTRAATSATPDLDPALTQSLRKLGLENVTAFTSTSGALVAGGSDPPGPLAIYENRRYRHTSTELGLVSVVPGAPAIAYEKRLGLTSAAIAIPADGSIPTDVRYPTDGKFPKPPAGPVQGSTRKSLDLLVGPLFTYELPRLFTETQVRIDLQPELRFNPWPGGRGRLAMVFPVRNDFRDVDPQHPDVDRVRPGPMMFEQYGWSPGAALVSACGGLFGSNRYGMSFGIARPMRGGEILIDSQADITGFVAASDSGLTYSSLSRWTGFVGVGYRPPGLDLNVRFRAAKFLESDQGLELELSRLMGDLEVAFDLQQIHVSENNGYPAGSVRNGVVRFTFPIPPMVRPTGQVVRVLPVDRFSVNYREESQPVGLYVSNVASREDFLRQLDRSDIVAGADRYQAAREGKRYLQPKEDPEWVSMIGMTGFVNTPWAGVIGDKDIEVGYNKVPKEAAYQDRDVHSNEIYYASLGFLPHVEAGLRWTVVPGSRPFFDIVPESHYLARDRMFSARIELLEARRNRPGVAVGIEDINGTRFFHSTYVVTGLPFEIYRLQNRVTLGYAPQVFRASHRVLDGWFGAYEVTAWRRVVTAIENDSRELNASLGIDLGFGLRARAALLDLKHPGIGAGWFKAL